MNAFDKFVSDKQITIKSVANGVHIIDGKTPFKWNVCLQMGEKKFICPFQMGAGHIGSTINNGKTWERLEGKKYKDAVHAIKGNYGSRWVKPIPPTLRVCWSVYILISPAFKMHRSLMNGARSLVITLTV